MKLLLVYCHPDPSSYGAALRQAAASGLREAGHELREIDLYAEGFNPVLSPAEKRSYLSDTARNIEGVAEHVAALRWAEGWVVVYPTWFYGVPAMLKGWLERVWLPGVSFRIATAKRRTIGGELKNMRLFVGITTSGSPWWWLKVIGDPGRSLFMKGMKPLYARGCKMRWMQLYNMNHATPEEHLRLTRAIEAGINASSHLLALVTPNTKGSWWVPFEMGSCRALRKPLAFLVHKEVPKLPSYFAVGTSLETKHELFDWAKELSNTTSQIERRAAIASLSPSPLDKYLELIHRRK